MAVCLTRQVLLSRHLLRNLATIDEDGHVPYDILQNGTLNCFRAIITILSGVNQETCQFSSPYEPPNRPETHFLAFSRKDRIFETSAASGEPSLTFFFSNGSSIGYENSNHSIEDKILLFEITHTGKGVTLSTKRVGDERVNRLRGEPLWRGMASAEQQRQASQFIDLLEGLSPKSWLFWRKWYQGFINGEPINWKLQRSVAQIADDIWEAGAEAVAAEIERISATLDLKAEIASLKENLLAHEAIAATGHNQGPPLDDIVEVRKTIQLIWPIVEDLETEADSEAPSANRLRELRQKLLDISIIIAKYFGVIADIAVKKSVETFSETGTKWAIRASVATYASTNEGVQSVAKAAWELAKVLTRSSAG